MPSDPGLSEAMAIVASGDAAAIERQLGDMGKLGTQWGPLLIARLGDKQVHDAVRDALVSLAPRIVGQLHDALLDPEQPDAARRRLFH